MDIKQSYYNITFEKQNKFLIYNTYSGSLIELDKNEYMKYFKGIDFIYDKKVKLLEENGFFVYENFDELDNLYMKIKRGRFGGNQISLVIAPCLSCNFDCSYCYEKGNLHNKFMTTSVQEKILEYINCLAKNKKRFYIAWTGGEPLLAINTILSLSKKIKSLFSKKRISYEGFIVTNGSLLTPDIAKKLKDVGISSYQITIDGNRENHNKNRPFKNGSGTYDIIIDNIKNSYVFIDRMTIRINVYKDSVNSCNELIEHIELIDLDNKIDIDISRIQNTNNSNYKGDIYSYDEFKNKQLEELYSLTPNALNLMFPMTKLRYCMADTVNEIIVGPSGEIYKCWSDIGVSEKIVGDIKFFVNNIGEDVINYLDWKPWNNDDCRLCKFLPVCLGGCPMEIYENKEPKCEVTYDYLSKIIDIYLDYLKEGDYEK